MTKTVIVLMISFSLAISTVPAWAIYGGEPSTERSAVAIVLAFKGVKYITCSGALISPQYVLSAAHCAGLDELNELTAGTHDSWVTVRPADHYIYFGSGFAAFDYASPNPRYKDQSNSLAVGQIIEVDAIFIHPKYRAPNFDLALLHLSKPAPVKPIDLPTNDLEVPGQSFLAIGSDWKQMSEPNRTLTPTEKNSNLLLALKKNLATEHSMYLVCLVRLLKATTPEVLSFAGLESSEQLIGIAQGPRYTKSNPESGADNGGRYTSILDNLVWINSVLRSSSKR